MSEFCYTTVCEHGEVSVNQQNEMVREFCDVFRQAASDVGGASMLETSPCYLRAMQEVRPRLTDTEIQAERRNVIAERLISYSTTKDTED